MRGMLTSAQRVAAPVTPGERSADSLAEGFRGTGLADASDDARRRARLAQSRWVFSVREGVS
jgi:hypothetical protein